MFCRSVVGLLVEPGYVPTAAGKFFKNPASSPDSPWLASALAASDCECLSRISANSGASYGSQSRAWLPGHCTGREIFGALLETFLVASLGGPIVVPPSDPREGVIGPYIQIQSTN